MTARPFVPADVDLRDFAYMPLDVQRLRDSKFTATVKPEEFRAGVLLWCAAWHQVPAGTLPDDDVELAKLAGYGYGLKDWRKVKAGALYGWSKCDDGRLHHKIAAEKALESWESKLKHGHNRYMDRMRKENKRRKDSNLPELPIMAFDDWKVSGRPEEFRQNAPPIPTESTSNSAGIPPENALKGSEGKRSEVNLRDLKNRDVGVNPPPVPSVAVDNSKSDRDRPPDTAESSKVNVAIGKSSRSKSNGRGSGQQWGDMTWVNATARTVEMERRTGESDSAWTDRVFDAIRQRQNAAKSA